MIDIELIRSNTDLVKKKMQERGVSMDIDVLLRDDAHYRTLLREIETLRSERKSKGTTAKDDIAVRELLKALKEKISTKESVLRDLREKTNDSLALLPNLHADDVPIGKDEMGNQVIRTVERPTTFTFMPKDYLTLAEDLGIIDVKRAGKVSGARFGYLLGAMAQLEFALIQYAQKILLKEGFTLVIPPVMIKAQNMTAMGYLAGGGESETYHLKEDDLYLVGTSEQSIGPMHRDEMFNADDLPKRYLSFSTCFRREAGSYGKDTKGIIRVHQFDKLEMFSFTTPDKSDEEHEFFLAMEEKLVQGLGIPYRVLRLCSGDIGFPSARTYDIEMWFPSENKYRETHSSSTTTDYQSRALNIKVSTNGEKMFVHMLNGTAFTNRTTIALIENFQQKDGSIAVPKVLQPYMNGLKKIEKK